MISVLAAFFAGLAAHQLIDVTRLELGSPVWNLAPAALAASTAAGLLARARLPYLGACLGLVLLAWVRSPLVELALGAGGGALGPGVFAGLVMIVLIGLLFGRQLAPLCEGRLLFALAGWALAELALAAGLGGWRPGLAWTLSLTAILLASLAEAGRQRRHARRVANGDVLEWAALAPAWALGLVWLALRRHVPAYVTPPPGGEHEVALALLAPGLLVAVSATLLVSSAPRVRSWLLAAGLLAVALAAWKTAAALTLYRFPTHVDRTWELRATAQGLPLGAGEWHAWLGMFAGWAAAAGGLALGALRARALAPALLGLGAAWACQEWLSAGSDWAPQQLLALGAGISLVGLGALWRPQALFALPAALVVVGLFPEEHRDELGRVRRIGEMEAAFSARSRLGEIVVFGAGAADNSSPDGRASFGLTFTGERRAFAHPLSAQAAAELDSAEDSVGDDGESGQEAEHGGQDEIPPPLVRAFGLRLNGLGAHEGHAPLGPEGTLGRWLGGLDPGGSALLLGHLAEVSAAELLRREPKRDLGWASEVPMEIRMRRRLLAELGFGREIPDAAGGTRVALGGAAAGSLGLVVLSPDRAGWPLSGRVLTRELLAEARRALALGGRCVAFVDSTDLDARALAARLGAFGQVFGERSLACLVVRGLHAPFVVLVGWVDDAGAPDPARLLEVLRVPELEGTRASLATPAELRALVLADGAALARLGDTSAVHELTRSIDPGRRSRGWAGLAALEVPEPRTLTPWAGEAVGSVRELARALAGFDRSRYDVDAPTTAMTVQVRQDVDWAAFDGLVGRLERLALAQPEHPALPVVLAALLEPLAVHGEYGRFADVWRRVGADSLGGWRLPRAQAVVLRASREDELATQAEDRARAWVARGGH